MGLLTILFFAPAFAEENSEEVIESVTIIGTAEDQRNLAGSGQIISAQDWFVSLLNRGVVCATGA